MILFLVTNTDPNDTSRSKHVIVLAHDREQAKRRAFHCLHCDPDHYIVSPLTAPGEPVHISLPISSEYTR